MTPIDTIDGPRLNRLLARTWPTLAFPTLPATTRLIVDSRQLRTGDVFVAMPGVHADGRDFIVQALQQGAALILAHVAGENEAGALDDEARVVAVPGLKARLGGLCVDAFEVPEPLGLTAVTGTNGKSSVAHYIALLGEALGRPSGEMGTLGIGRPGHLVDAGLTTPGVIDVHRFLASCAQAGAEHVALEASSHALDQGRLDGALITTAVFTNLSRDHLDYHQTMSGYAAAKARLFQREELELAVVNADDPLSRLMLAGLKPGVRTLHVGTGPDAAFRILDVSYVQKGLHARIETPEGERTLSLGLMGRFNLVNALLSVAVLYGQGVATLDEVLSAAESLTPVPGRMEVLDAPGPAVLIDYAHTPDALTNALEAVRAHVPGRLWCIVGCGGDRDPGKRPLMASAALECADRLVITDDNPRSEAPESIRSAMFEAVAQSDDVEVIGGRQAAIEAVIERAADDDVIVIAGKGHEAYQEIQGVRHPFSDQAVARAALEARHG
ncbi:UDP-N-acetylmuramoyl-L-alanyl-D-glutamate--2,6-diaminopimelate ligase [Larsenimonas salina]|uniref:UDP-N-acetylmuramoyl-L-alanyl-D-glutamate--2, 6-diaminopimelate ligase n=1 Tax=Larsenimonas salina TaxID=1295565 RepID=UPI0020746DD7|nr:UDP-N-acetylmuramoyl-L-alanyl-D-glutamate--2,6-diaminopimelate ligase [Larsenimonas salina]MCM5703140.1 UDP-N-acetylmuramoyl-L-alanyl-D-glutamate--2,6-diaminopimelate ligase [Larsenimonas salina]